MDKIIKFRLELPDSLNRVVLSQAALSGKTKHEWIEKAIAEKIQREGSAV